MMDDKLKARIANEIREGGALVYAVVKGLVAELDDLRVALSQPFGNYCPVCRSGFLDCDEKTPDCFGAVSGLNLYVVRCEDGVVRAHAWGGTAYWVKPADNALGWIADESQIAARAP
jgi:hypothetical protein